MTMAEAIDKPSRSIAKSFSWRVIASLTTLILVFIFTGKITLALTVGFLEFTLKLIFFYVHERTWNKISWGR